MYEHEDIQQQNKGIHAQFYKWFCECNSLVRYEMRDSIKPNDEVAKTDINQALHIKSTHMKILKAIWKGGAKLFTSKWSKIIISKTLDTVQINSLIKIKRRY